MVVKQMLEPQLEPIFDQDSYGYRPGKSAHQAVESCRKRCWKYDWVVDLDIKGFFDSIDHDLLMRAIQFHTSERWVVLYLRRWLEAPVELPDGTLQPRTPGPPKSLSTTFWLGLSALALVGGNGSSPCPKPQMLQLIRLMPMI